MTVRKKTINEPASGEWNEAVITELFKDREGVLEIFSHDKNGHIQHLANIRNPVLYSRAFFVGRLAGRIGTVRATPAEKPAAAPKRQRNNSRGKRSCLETNTASTVTETNPQQQLAGELETIQLYLADELARINRDYSGETKAYMIGMLAHNVGHMVLSIDYKELKLKTLDHLFGQLGTTFEEVVQAIRRDMAWQEL